MQHGIKQTRLSPQAAEAKRLKEQVKIEQYVTLQNEVMARVSQISRSQYAADK